MNNLIDFSNTMNVWKLLNFLIWLNSAMAVSVECNFTDFKSLYTCVNLNLDTYDIDNFITEIVGDHIEEKSNSDVQQFYVRNANLEYFPGGLSDFFPNLESIRIKNSSLKYIFKSDLKGLSNLTFFAAVENKIETIGPRLFEENPFLTEIHLEKNLIEQISEDLLDYTEGTLSVVHLHNNECIQNQPEHFNANEVKTLIIEKCSLTKQDMIRNMEQQFEKLSNEINILKLKIGETVLNSSDPTSMSSFMDSKEIEILKVQADKLVFEKRNLMSNISFSMQTLNENANEIKNLTEENHAFKTMISLLQNANVELESKFNSTIQKKDDIIVSLKKDLQKALLTVIEMEKSTQRKISSLNSVNRELNKKLTINEANMAYLENLARYKKNKVQINP